MSSNILQHTKPAEKKTGKGVKRKVKDDHLHFTHYLETLRSFQPYACKQLTVRTVHTRKVGLTAFDTKRWMCEDTVHTHLHGHKDTVLNSSGLSAMSGIVNCVTTLGIYTQKDLPRTALHCF